MINEKVSIVMPCHNGEKYLEFSIESVLNQTYSNWELLVIDDNSTDSSLSIIKHFVNKDLRIHLLENPNSIGKPSAPRNVGIKNAVGRYIAFLDCDDLWVPTKLENQLKLFDETTSVVYSFYKKMDEEGNVRPEIISSPKTLNFKKNLNGNCIGNLTGIYDTEKVGKVFQKDIGHEDYLMWQEILKKGFQAKNTNTVEAIYRDQRKSISGNKLIVFKWTWNIYRHELGLNLFISIYHFFKYTLNGIIKFIK